jgi:O-antigen ligase
LSDLIEFWYTLVLEIPLNCIITELLFYILCMMYHVWWLGSISSGAVFVLMYFDMLYIQWHHLAKKKDLWNKVYMIMHLKIIGIIISPIPKGNVKVRNKQWVKLEIQQELSSIIPNQHLTLNLSGKFSKSVNFIVIKI